MLCSSENLLQVLRNETKRYGSSVRDGYYVQWICNSSKTKIEQLRIKLNRPKFRVADIGKKDIDKTKKKLRNDWDTGLKKKLKKPLNKYCLEKKYKIEEP